MSDAYAGPKTSQYKVWHIPQIPGKAFQVELEDLEEAKRLVTVLALYDLFQYDNNIKPDYSNASGIMEWLEDEGEYSEVDLEDDE